MTQSDAIGNDMVHQTVSRYCSLKKDFCSKWHLYCNNANHLQAIVEFYSFTINSDRDVASVKSLERLLDILERRDELSEFYVKALKVIVNQTILSFGENGGQQWLFALKKRVEEYENFIRPPTKICSCGAEHKRCEPVQLNRFHRYEVTFRALNLPVSASQAAATEKIYDVKEDLQVVFDHIGNDWRKFLRGLDGMTERDINHFRSVYKQNDKLCFFQCLVHWREIVDPDLLTRECISKALKTCGREDIVFKILSL